MWGKLTKKVIHKKIFLANYETSVFMKHIYNQISMNLFKKIRIYPKKFSKKNIFFPLWIIKVLRYLIKNKFIDLLAIIICKNLNDKAYCSSC